MNQANKSLACKCSDVFLVRHGESNNNCIYEQIRAKFGSSISHERFEEEYEKAHDADCGLSPKGQLQSLKLRDFLQSHRLSTFKSQSDHAVSNCRVFSSPMKRCLLTAEHVASGLGNKPVLVHPRLFESDGCYQTNLDGSTVGLAGLKASEVEEKFPSFKCLPGMENGWYHLPEKESPKQFISRVQEIVQFLWTEHESGHEEASVLVLVTHGNLIRELISQLACSRSILYTHCNTGLSHVQLWSGGGKERFVSVQGLNRVDHLAADPTLVGGNDVFGDHWIQEFVSNEDK
eukprot:gene2173-2371_t